MKLTPSELALIRSKGLYVTEKFDGCGKPLNQTVRSTIPAKLEIYCSAACRDFAFYGDCDEAKKHASLGPYFGATLTGKKHGAICCKAC